MMWSFRRAGWWCLQSGHSTLPLLPSHTFPLAQQGLQLPSGDTPLLRHGVLHRLPRGDPLCHGASSLPLLLWPWCCYCCFSLFPFSSPPPVRHFLPFLTDVFTEVPQTWPSGSALSHLGPQSSWLCRAQHSPWWLPLQPPPLPQQPCHIHQIPEAINVTKHGNSKNPVFSNALNRVSQIQHNFL